MKIDSIELYDLAVPLVKPYHTAFGDLPHFDTYLAVVRAGEKLAAGESCPVKGYSWEGPEDVWEFGKSQAEKVVGLEIEEAMNRLRPYFASHPFGVTSIFTALETLAGDLPPLEANAEFPLVGILNVSRVEEIADELESVLTQGYQTIKFKVGFDVDQDIHKVQEIQKLLKGRAQLRLDANQGYTFEEAMRFVKEVDPEDVELFEQPFPEKDWETAARFAPLSPLPVMLDESIYGPEDVKRTCDMGSVKYIKLKLMKSGGIGSLLEESRLVLERGLQLVIGNGVATDLSCYQEAWVGVQLGLQTAGEMNGYLKLKSPLLGSALGFAQGKAVLKEQADLMPDQATLDRHTRGKVVFTA